MIDKMDLGFFFLNLLVTVNASAGPFCDPAHPPGAEETTSPNIGLTQEQGTNGCPDGMVLIESYCIDRFESALEWIREDGKTVPWSPYHNPGARKVRAVSLKGGVPQGYISGRQAQDACANAGKRLCSDVEWLRACRGKENRAFPYGMERYPGQSSPSNPFCNESRAVHPAIELFPGQSNPYNHLDNACLNQLPAAVARSGAFGGCATSEGVYDLMGNLHEWTADPRGTFRGGYFMDTKINGSGCAYVTTAHDFTHWDYSTGFRCCADERVSRPH